MQTILASNIERREEDYRSWPLRQRLELLAFDARLAGVPQELLEALWEAIELVAAGGYVEASRSESDGGERGGAAHTDRRGRDLQGYLTLIGTGPAGGQEHCILDAQGHAQASFNRLLWSQRGDCLTLTYPNWPGATIPVDTAVIARDALTWHVKRITDPVSDLTLERTAIPVSEGAPPACQ
jgi:hypothetical protein